MDRFYHRCLIVSGNKRLGRDMLVVEVSDLAEGSQSNRALVREAAPFLDQFKYEVAQEIGVNPPRNGYWGDLPARQCGAVGGHMVRKMIEMAEQQLAGRSH